MKRNPKFWLVAGLLGLGLSRLLWVSHIPYSLDEPRLVELSQRQLDGGQWATHSFQSTRRGHHGPFALWLTAVALKLGRDPMGAARWRAAFQTLGAALAVLWLSKLCPTLWAPLGALGLLAPFLWHHSRTLWDNNLLIPLSALGCTAYLSFVLRNRFRDLALTFLFFSLALLTHLSALGLWAALGIHLAAYGHPWWRRHWPWLLLLVLLSLTGLWPYLSTLSLGTTPTQFGGSWALLGFPLTAPQLFTLVDVGPQIGWWAPLALALFTAPFYLAAWKGAWSALRKGDPIGIWCFLLWFCHGVLLFFSAPGFRAHYFHAIWLPVFYFLWREGSRWRRTPLGATVLTVGALACAVSLAVTQWQVIRHGGARNVYGPSLQSQWEAAKQGAAVETLERSEAVPLSVHFGVESLLRYVPHPSPSPQSVGRLEWRSPEAHGAWLEVRRAYSTGVQTVE